MSPAAIRHWIPGIALAAATVVLACVSPAAEAAFPGKPGRIAYTAQLPGQDESTGTPGQGGTVDRGYDVFTVNPDGTDRRRLTFNGPEPDDDQGPAWSPDGDLIAFHSNYPFVPDTPYPVVPGSDILLMAPDGSGRREIPNAGGVGPLFLPGGQRIFAHYISIDFIGSYWYSINIDGSDKRQVAESVLDNYGPHVSPDGRWKVFARTASGSPPADLFMSRLDGSELQQLTATPSINEMGPVFSPDGSAIAYSADTAGPTTVTILDLRTRSQRVVSDPSVSSGDPDWGPIPVDCRGNRATQVGTSGPDALLGTGTDVITGLEGDDRIGAGDDRDLLCGDSGNDTLKGGKNRDVLIGGKDRDVLKGGKGRDTLIGGKGKRDVCIGGKGRDRAKGCERRKRI
jgi:RTX calcium-binding nonapeptide repeat (4 copies)/WD40-like Beta Propeller Repeat